MQSETGRPEDVLPGQDRPVPTPAPAQRRRGDVRPVPVVDAAFAHLTLDGLRSYRSALTEEEHKVSYWRRILQARLDVVANGSSGRGLDQERLAPVLTSARVGAGRRALVEVAQDDDIPPLPQLSELWERTVTPGDEPGRQAFVEDLRAAETQLSEYRAALHGRIGEATGELIARYRQAPDLCLSALPMRPERRARS